MIDLTIILIAAGTFLLGMIIGLFVINTNYADKLQKAQSKASQLLHTAEQDKLKLVAEAKEKEARYQQAMVDYQRRHDQVVLRLDQSIYFLENKNTEREQQAAVLSQALLQESSRLDEIQQQFAKLKQEMAPKLASRAGTNFEQVKKELIIDLQNDLELISELKLKKYEEYLKEESPMIAKNYLIEVIQRFSASTSVEKKSLLVPIARDETILKLIGTNAEILTFIEEATGCDIVFEHFKKGFTVSHFQHVRRHIARETLLKLMKDRVVDIERVRARLLEATTETRNHLIEIGNKVVEKLDLVYRKFPEDFKEILGRLKYRTSYGQNILKHCFEVGYFTLMLGNELGLNQEVCKIGGFFHDLGKAIDQEDGRPHDILTKEIMERFQIFSWEEIHAAWTHHDAIPIETAEAFLVKAGDAISAGRPGARQETIEKYLARIRAIEGIATSYQGVHKTYAISGGRELRVLVDHKELNDENLPELAATIAREIEGSVAYPGQIKVNVIRKVQYYRTAKEKNKPTIKS